MSVVGFALGASVADCVLWAVVAIMSGGMLCVAYGVFVERRWYRQATYRLPILPTGASAAVTLLHVSDLHLVASDKGKMRFLSSLPRADVTVVTGDILGEPEAVDAAAQALRPIRGTAASYFVLGSNDYFQPRPLNYAAYFRRAGRQRRKGVRSRTDDLVQRLEADGWTLLSNRKAEVSSDGVALEIVGLDDPHMERHDLRVAERTHPSALGLAVVHSPDPAPELAALGYDLILSGHTHGGQVRMPFVGALVTNSTIPTKLAMGLSRLGRAYLHVSPGLGTSKFAPFRFLCRPEATLIELRPRQERAEAV